MILGTFLFFVAFEVVLYFVMKKLELEKEHIAWTITLNVLAVIFGICFGCFIGMVANRDNMVCPKCDVVYYNTEYEYCPVDGSKLEVPG